MDGIRQTKAGSRNSDGNVPNVNWNDDKFHVNWYNPDNSNDNLRAREVLPVYKSRFYARLIFIL